MQKEAAELVLRFRWRTWCLLFEHVSLRRQSSGVVPVGHGNGAHPVFEGHNAHGPLLVHPIQGPGVLRLEPAKIWGLALLFSWGIFDSCAWRLLLLNGIRVHLVQLTIDVDSEILRLLKEEMLDVSRTCGVVLLHLLSFRQLRLVVFKAQIADERGSLSELRVLFGQTLDRERFHRKLLTALSFLQL